MAFNLPFLSKGNKDDQVLEENLTMTASVNGVEYSRGNASDMNWTFAELIAHASRNTTLYPGDLIIELPGAAKDYGETIVNVTIPTALDCPDGTKRVP